MPSSKELQLGVFGLSEYELRVLRTISILSKNRPRTYVLQDSDSSAAADFAVVDCDDPQALKNWHAFQASNPLVPTVLVGKAPESESTGFQIDRPIMATRLLAVLDQMHLSKEQPAFAQAKAPDTEPASPSSIPQEPPAEPGEAVSRALVVDDSLPIRRQLELELQNFVGEVDLAVDGEQAIKLLSAKRYDIVFLDVVLPGMDGYQICRKIKQAKSTKNTPVIMLTGKTSPFDRVRGKLAGCDTYLTKPVDQVKFNKEVQTYLRQEEQERPTGGQVPETGPSGSSSPGRA